MVPVFNMAGSGMAMKFPRVPAMLPGPRQRFFGYFTGESLISSASLSRQHYLLLLCLYSGEAACLLSSLLFSSVSDPDPGGPVFKLQPGSGYREGN